MSNNPIGRTLIPQLNAIYSATPRVARIQKRIVALLNPSSPIDMQHHMKALWHRERVGNILSDRPMDLMPVTVEFVPSLDCNYECPTCTYRKWKERTIADIGRRQMSYEVMMTLLNKIEDADVHGVIFTGGGEPFKNPHTIDGLEFAAKKDYAVGLFTNGSLLNADLISRLANSGIDFIRVSFNTADADNYVRFHGLKDTEYFEAARKNIRLLAQALAGTETSFGIGVIVNQLNVDYMRTVAEFVRETLTEGTPAEIGSIAYRPVVNYGQISSDRSQQISPVVARKVKENFEVIKTILQGLPVTPILAADYFDEVSNTKPKPSGIPSKCRGHSWGASIAYDGGVYLCSERDGEKDYLIGNLLTASFRDIWLSEQRADVIKHAKDCPPTCKIHRTNKIVDALMSGGGLSREEIEEVQSFLDVIRSFGDPGGTNFI